MSQFYVYEQAVGIGRTDVAVVIDVLRATTSIATALHHGAVCVVPARTVAEARELARRGGADTLLAGERQGVPPRGFSLGNSPREFSRRRVGGQRIVLTTTNGTAALMAAQSRARDVYTGSYVNFSEILAVVRSALRRELDVALVCAGSEGRFSLEDTACAGRLVRLALHRLPGRGRVQLNDAARSALHIEKPYDEKLARLFQHADHGRTLRRLGFARDLAACRALDAHPVVPHLVGRELVAL